MTLKIETILEFSTFFPEKNFAEFQIDTILKKYSREMLIKAINILSKNYGNAYIPDPHKSFFSSVVSSALLNDIEERLNLYLNKKHKKSVCFCTKRTILELLRQIFKIPPTDFKNDGTPDSFEYDLFCVILYLNEVLMKFHSYEESSYSNFQTLIYLSNYVHNDLINIDYKRVLLTQIYYFNCLSHFLEEREEAKDLKGRILDKLKVDNLDEYLYTVTSLVAFYVENKSFQMVCLDTNKAFRFNEGICDFLSIGKNDVYFSSIHDENERNNRNLNLDYRVFRAHPLIKMEEGCYIIFSLPILCERLYNGFVFDLMNVFAGKDFYSFYNKHFVERYLFRNTMVTCLGKKTSYTYPTITAIKANVNEEEQDNQPDFYIREKYNLIIFECKSIKINSSIRDDADVKSLTELLQNKLYESKTNIDKNRHTKKKTEKVGISQLVYCINCIEDDIFPFDNSIPDDVAYYPVLVLDDPLIVQLGLTNLVNQWYLGRVNNELKEAICHPLIVMSIDTLALYSDTFKQQGFTTIFDKFFSENTHFAQDGTVKSIDPMVDFNVFMQSHYHPNKKLINDTLLDLKKVAKAHIFPYSTKNNENPLT